jgi:hypothetical protein
MGLKDDLLTMPLEARFAYDAERNIFFLNMEGMSLVSQGEVQAIGTEVGNRLAVIGKKVQMAGDVKPAAVQYLRGNPDEVLPRPRDPGAEAHLLQLADFGGIGHFPRLPDGGDAPPGLLVRVQAIGFERDDGMLGRDGKLATAIGPDDDVAVVEREVDQLHRRQRPAGINDPAHGHRGHQPEAFIPGQLLKRRAVGVHVTRMPGRRRVATGNEVPSRRALSTSRRRRRCVYRAGR